MRIAVICQRALKGTTPFFQMWLGLRLESK